MEQKINYTIINNTNNMKSLLIGVFISASIGSLMAQTDINLTFRHTFNADDLTYGTTYTRPGLPAVSLSRVQYYLSGFELTHDGGQTLALPDKYILGSGNISNYNLANENITTLEGIRFDLGVDSARNHLGTSNWSEHHPLGSKSPTMDWGWPAGYFFWTFDGMVDGNGDGTPNVPFQMHGFGDNLIRNVDLLTGFTITGSTIDLTVYVNVADWLLNNDLTTMGFEHSSGPKNATLGDNTNDETVFTLVSSAGIKAVSGNGSHIYADNTLSYAPTIYYDLATLDKVDVFVYDMTGKVVLEDRVQHHEGNYFIRKELESGSYIIIFKNDNLEEQLKFTVQK
jgi:hypothetical protein